MFYPEMGLLAKDVESCLMLQKLVLEVLDDCRGSQILAGQSRAHFGSSGVLAESAAGAQAGPHTFQREEIN